jgi:hypothetical protein
VIRHTLTLEPFADSFPLISLSDLRQGASKVVERAGDEDCFGGRGCANEMGDDPTLFPLRGEVLPECILESLWGVEGAFSVRGAGIGAYAVNGTSQPNGSLVANDIACQATAADRGTTVEFLAFLGFLEYLAYLA